MNLSFNAGANRNTLRIPRLSVSALEQTPSKQPSGSMQRKGVTQPTSPSPNLTQAQTHRAMDAYAAHGGQLEALGSMLHAIGLYLPANYDPATDLGSCSDSNGVILPDRYLTVVGRVLERLSERTGDDADIVNAFEALTGRAREEDPTQMSFSAKKSPIQTPREADINTNSPPTEKDTLHLILSPMKDRDFSEFRRVIRAPKEDPKLIRAFRRLGAKSGESGLILDGDALLHRCAEIGMSDTETRLIINFFDEDINGEIDLEEFKRVMSVDVSTLSATLVDCMARLLGHEPGRRGSMTFSGAEGISVSSSEHWTMNTPSPMSGRSRTKSLLDKIHLHARRRQSSGDEATPEGDDSMEESFVEGNSELTTQANIDRIHRLINRCDQVYHRMGKTLKEARALAHEATGTPSKAVNRGVSSGSSARSTDGDPLGPAPAHNSQGRSDAPAGGDGDTSSDDMSKSSEGGSQNGKPTPKRSPRKGKAGKSKKSGKTDDPSQLVGRDRTVPKFRTQKKCEFLYVPPSPKKVYVKKPPPVEETREMFGMPLAPSGKGPSSRSTGSTATDSKRGKRERAEGTADSRSQLEGDTNDDQASQDQQQVRLPKIRNLCRNVLENVFHAGKSKEKGQGQRRGSSLTEPEVEIQFRLAMMSPRQPIHIDLLNKRDAGGRYLPSLPPLPIGVDQVMQRIDRKAEQGLASKRFPHSARVEPVSRHHDDTSVSSEGMSQAASQTSREVYTKPIPHPHHIPKPPPHRPIAHAEAM
jgi:hypothetical protein